MGGSLRGLPCSREGARRAIRHPSLGLKGCLCVTRSVTPIAEVPSFRVPGGVAAVSFCSGLEVSVGAVGVELGQFLGGRRRCARRRVVGSEAVVIEVVTVSRSVCIKVVMHLVSATVLKMLVLIRPVLWWSASVYVKMVSGGAGNPVGSNDPGSR